MQACAQGFKEGGGVIGVHTLCDLGSYWLIDRINPMSDLNGYTPTYLLHLALFLTLSTVYSKYSSVC